MIYHLAEPTDWDARADTYAAPSLETEGFIHCSTADQVDRVAAAIYPGRNDMILLTIDEDAVEARIVFEDLYETGEDFPHIYGPIPVVAIVKHRVYSPTGRRPTYPDPRIQG